MKPDYTQQQSLGGLQRSEQLSLQSTVPPAEIQGYKIDKLLGQGAFGQVWQGSDLNTGRQVAIKFYLHRGGVDWSLLKREVTHLVNMSTGRYIVQVLSVGWEAEPPYYIMEYLENGSLEDMIRAHGALTISETVTKFREIADGLSFAHSKGVLHCDLKPANVVLDHDWRPRLADFGQSRMTDEQTPSLGTLFYMAPEQADLEASADSAWDVYALGAIAYTMLVGSPPYRTPEVVETLDTANSLPDRLKRYRETIRKAPRPKLHYRRRGIDKGLCQIVDRCLAARPENRYRNVQQVIGAIDSWNRAKTRRPLYILGIVGPIILLLLMMFFSARSVKLASDGVFREVQKSTVKSDRFAAKLAARTLEKEIEGLFRLIETEARSKELRDLVAQNCSEAEEDLLVLSTGEPNVAVAERFQKLVTSQRLQDYLAQRLQDVISEGKDGGVAATFNSLFVNEAMGTNIATTYADPDDQTLGSSIGRNFAYRTYFTGLREDGDKSLPRSSFKPTRRTHLSASFQSTSTGKWKLGISAPLWDDDRYADGFESPPEDVLPLGILVLTINLGDFNLLNAPSVGEEDSLFSVIVEGRPGKQQGNVLQHPLFHGMDKEELMQAPPPRIDERQMRTLQATDGITDYRDPAAKFPGGESYSGTWLAAMQQVSLPRNQSKATNESMSDLWVLVQERSTSVETSLEQLGAQLQVETYWELGALLAVIVLMWYFVLRLNRSSSQLALNSSNLGSRTTGYSSTVDSNQ